MCWAKELLIRHVGDGDFHALASFFSVNNELATKRQFSPFPLTDESALAVTDRKQKDRYYVAVLHGSIIGLCMLRGWEEGFDVPSLGILVDRNHRGCGLGRRLAEYAIEEARPIGCQQIRLSVFADNAIARRLYTSLGFEEVSEESVADQGSMRRRILMIKAL